MFCSGCGKEIHETAKSCPSCGAQQKVQGEKSRIAAALLAFFLGGSFRSRTITVLSSSFKSSHRIPHTSLTLIQLVMLKFRSME